jgi:hypothetical protein
VSASVQHKHQDRRRLHDGRMLCSLIGGNFITSTRRTGERRIGPLTEPRTPPCRFPNRLRQFGATCLARHDGKERKRENSMEPGGNGRR